MSPLDAIAIKAMRGRDFLAAGIAALDERSELARAVVEAYGAAAVSDDLRAFDELCAGLADGLRFVATRAAVRVEDMAKGKDGAPSYMSKLRHEISQEYAGVFVSAVRRALSVKTSFAEKTPDAA